jgi:hypothetical protein
VSLGLAACGGSGPSATTPTGVPGSSTGTGSASGSAFGSASGSASSASASSRLATAFDGLAAGYTFDTTVSIGGKAATHASGRSIGGASDFVVESEGASITYRTIPPRSWVKQPGKAWVAVDSGVPDGDPLDALRSPATVVIDSDSPDGVRLRASYPAAAFGLTSSEPVTVTLILRAGGSVGAIYTVSTSAGPATSETTLTPATGQGPIAAP